jgi:lysophospholipid acyltransferase (LPLAT)-like uncharacterized protein
MKGRRLIGLSARRALGAGVARYLRLVQRSTRWRTDPPELLSQILPQLPVIAATWHGQHMMATLLKPADVPMWVMVSRHGDGEINAVTAERLGFGVVRGSGGHGVAVKIRRRGGVEALRALLGCLQAGDSVTMTTDVPKVHRIAGMGTVLLAKLSGRPIFPVAIMTRRRIVFSSWDRLTLGLPFGRGGAAIGQPIVVPRDADDDALEQARCQLEQALEDIHARAYELAGGAPWIRRHVAA